MDVRHVGQNMWWQRFIRERHRFLYRFQDSIVGIITRLCAGLLGFDTHQEQQMIFLSQIFRPAVKPIQCLIQCVPGIIFLAPLSMPLPPSSAKVKGEHDYFFAHIYHLNVNHSHPSSFNVLIKILKYHEMWLLFGYRKVIK